jgi:hypothetical protein
MQRGTANYISGGRAIFSPLCAVQIALTGRSIDMGMKPFNDDIEFQMNLSYPLIFG